MRLQRPTPDLDQLRVPPESFHLVLADIAVATEALHRAVCNGGATGVYIYAYCFFYYFFRSEMDGFLQTSFFFGYMLVVCYAFFLMLGSVGLLSSLAFVRYIYQTLKCD